MNLYIILKIIFICIIGAISPGPSTFVVINNALKSKLKGIATAIGHGLGIAIYAICAVIGIDLLINSFPKLYIILNFLSFLLLFYLGISSFFSKEIIDDKFRYEENNIFFYFIHGISISLLNPKVIIFFTAIFTHIIPLDINAIESSIIVIIATVVDILWYILISIFVSWLSLKTILFKYQIQIRKVVGIIFIVISLLLIINLFL